MTYTIKKGDTLTSIAKKHNTTVNALASANNIKNKNLIYAGNTLEIPDGSSGGTVSGSSGVWNTVYEGTSDGKDSGYRQSNDVQDAHKELENWQDRRPGAYDSAYSDQLDALISAATGRAFSYDPLRDPLYRSYRDSYRQGGRLAMQDAMGMAASLTGGMGNSYAQSVGQQAYGAYMQDLAQVIPELYEAAYGRFIDEGDQLEDQIQLLSSLDDAQWDRYNDMLENYLEEGSFLLDKYETLSDADYERFLDYMELLRASVYIMKTAQISAPFFIMTCTCHIYMLYYREGGGRYAGKPLLSSAGVGGYTCCATGIYRCCTW